MRLLAIDPGPIESAYVTIGNDYKPLQFDKVRNEDLLRRSTLFTADQLVIENIGHYGTGMPAGTDVFDTCIWIGRLWQHFQELEGLTPTLVKRATVKTHLCGAANAKDGNVVQALIDRFAPGVRNHGKGVKNEPGFFQGFHRDIWQAFSLAVYWMDTYQQAPRKKWPPEIYPPGTPSIRWHCTICGEYDSCEHGPLR